MPQKRKAKNSTLRQRSGRELKAKYRGIPVLFFALVVVLVSLPFVSNLAKLFNPPCANSISCIKDLSGRYEDDREGVFMGRKITLPEYLAAVPVQKQILGTTSETKHISVDLSKQRLYAHEGDKLVYEFPVSTGKWGRTPTGEYKIWVKLLRTRMSGGSGNDYYNLPNVPYVMFFYNNEVSAARGFSIHGAYWHNNFGYTMSHGCVNMRPEDAEKIYQWADPAADGNITHATADNPGTIVTIYGEPPS